MTVDRDAEYLVGLVNELRKLPKETEWVEFKQNIANPEEIGEYISALSNAAALCGKDKAYLLWGISDAMHDVVGTTFRPDQSRKGNEELESWLLRLLSPRVLFRFHAISIARKTVVLLEISRASGKPVQFRGQELIRIGSYNKKLKDFPEIERRLWRIFDQIPFEELKAADRVKDTEVLSPIDYPRYFEMLDLSLPNGPGKILDRLVEDRLIVLNEVGSWDIFNLGAILFAKNLNKFKGLARKAIRVIFYEGKNRLKTIREQVGKKGYASGFEGLVEHLNALLPRNEVMGQALRKDVPMFPEVAVRELVANALIHQDFSITGAGPMIEVFGDRMEITNPGAPLVRTERFLDTPPRSRNEGLASFMRRLGICEERGSGIDKVVFETEYFQLPAPSFEAPEGCTRTVLFAHKAFREMDKADRVRACYLHACLRHVERDYMTNSSLRERFGIEPRNSASASRIIRDTGEQGLIKAYDPEQAKKNAKYVPFWA
jgi:ATP-dependent DNA helicase RecG